MPPGYVKLKEIKPVLSDYVREVRIILSSSPIPDEKGIHDARVLLKKSRAAMKLIRSQITAKEFDSNYLAFREAGRLMRNWREITVFRRILKEFKKDDPDLFEHLTGNEKITSILRKQEHQSVTTSNIVYDVNQINDLLAKAYFRLRFISINITDQKLLWKELENTFNEVQRCYLTARNQPDPSNIHEFRKKAKDLLYQLYFFRPLKPRSVRYLEKRIDDITQSLGKFNDLAQLIRELGYNYSKNGGSDPFLDELIVMIRHEQDKYLSKMWAPAFKTFGPGRRLFDVPGIKVIVLS